MCDITNVPQNVRAKVSTAKPIIVAYYGSNDYSFTKLENLVLYDEESKKKYEKNQDIKMKFEKLFSAAIEAAAGIHYTL